MIPPWEKKYFKEMEKRFYDDQSFTDSFNTGVDCALYAIKEALLKDWEQDQNKIKFKPNWQCDDQFSKIKYCKCGQESYATILNKITDHPDKGIPICYLCLEKMKKLNKKTS